MNDRGYSIYQITNLVNGMKYIGITGGGVDARWRQHAFSYSTRIGAAIRRHGEITFLIETLYLTNNLGHALDVERQFIRDHKSVWPNGYNATPLAGTAAETHRAFKKRPYRLVVKAEAPMEGVQT